MRSDCLVYLAGPISPRLGRSVEQNVAEALSVYVDLTRHGIPSHCPHLGAMFPSCHALVDYEQWMALDFVLIGYSTHVLMLDGWQSSAGAIREHVYALSIGKVVVTSLPDLLVSLGMGADDALLCSS